MSGDNSLKEILGFDPSTGERTDSSLSSSSVGREFDTQISTAFDTWIQRDIHDYESSTIVKKDVGKLFIVRELEDGYTGPFGIFREYFAAVPHGDTPEFRFRQRLMFLGDSEDGFTPWYIEKVSSDVRDRNPMQRPEINPLFTLKGTNYKGEDFQRDYMRGMQDFVRLNFDGAGNLFGNNKLEVETRFQDRGFLVAFGEDQRVNYIHFEPLTGKHNVFSLILSKEQIDEAMEGKEGEETNGNFSYKYRFDTAEKKFVLESYHKGVHKNTIKVPEAINYESFMLELIPDALRANPIGADTELDEDWKTKNLLAEVGIEWDRE